MNTSKMNASAYCRHIKGIVRQLAHSQGYYGRLAARLDELDAWDVFAANAREAGVSDAVDLAIWLEC